jgi:hypothetical protein
MKLFLGNPAGRNSGNLLRFPFALSRFGGLALSLRASPKKGLGDSQKIAIVLA